MLAGSIACMGLGLIYNSTFDIEMLSIYMKFYVTRWLNPVAMLVYLPVLCNTDGNSGTEMWCDVPQLENRALSGLHSAWIKAAHSVFNVYAFS